MRLPGRSPPGDTTTAPTTGIHSPAHSGSATVPWHRIIASQAEVATGRPVRGGTWAGACQLANWIAGRGTMDVPSYSPGVEVDEGETHTFRWMVRPRYVTTRYAFSLRMSCGDPIALAVSIGGAAHQVFAGSRQTARNEVYYIDRTAQSADEAELSLSITGAESMASAALIEALSIEALPRTVIACDANELGMQPDVFRSRLPIKQANIHDALIDRVDDLRDTARRTGLFQFARSDLDPWVISSGSDTALFSDPFALNGRQVFGDDTIAISSFWALCKCSDGTTAGQITVDNVSQGSAVDTVTIPTGTTSWTWIRSDNSITHDCEDNTTVDGRRVGRWDDTTITAKRTAGAGSISIATLSIFG